LSFYGYQTGYPGYYELMTKVLSVATVPGSSSTAAMARDVFLSQSVSRGLMQS
jgi:hypothetical protein